MRNFTALASSVLFCAGSAALAPARAAAQGAAPGVGGRSEIFVGSDLENYLRYLQTVGAVAPEPWSIRSFGPAQLERMLPADSTAHPWAARYDWRRQMPTGWADYIRPTVTLRYNSGFPYGSNDGPVWAGRGLTSAVQFGVAARWRALSVTLAPIAFRAENAAFPLASNGLTTAARFGDQVFPQTVDRPRRFGDGAYARLDPGQSTIRLDAFGLALGASTANQQWGPGDRYPNVLGNNAAGYPHVFFGTSRAANLWLFRLHARVVWGSLAQSDYSPVTGPEEFTSLDEPGRRRFTSGLVLVGQPRGLPGLELGAARFYHTPWREGGPTGRDIFLPVQTLFKKDIRNTDLEDPTSDFDNQLGSLFARWVLPRSGFELFAEFFRDDHNYDLRDLVLEPGHNAGYTLGVRKVFTRRDGQLLAVRTEITNHEPQPIGQWRQQGTIYAHAFLRQGHTQLGQLLASDAGVGGAAAGTAAAELYSPRGRWTAEWTRTLRQTVDTRDAAGNMPAAFLPIPRSRDVMHALTVERVLFLGRLDLHASLAAALDMNREFGGDRFNGNATVGARYNLR